MEDSKMKTTESKTKITDSKTKTESKTKSYWVPDEQGGYIEATLKEDDGKSAKVIVNGYEVRWLFKKIFFTLCTLQSQCIGKFEFKKCIFWNSAVIASTDLSDLFSDLT